MRWLVVVLLACCASGLVTPAVVCGEAPAETSQEIVLPPPATKGAMSLEEAVAKRRSVRGFTAEALTPQQLGQLLWAAQGITDPATGHRAAPSAMAMYPLTVYVFRTDGVFAYEPGGHKLRRLSDKDRRAEVTQPPRGGGAAPVTLVLTGDRSRMGTRMAAMAERFICMEAGHVAQNVALQATALGIATVTQAGINQDAISKTLALPETAIVLYAMPVGHPATPQPPAPAD